MNARSRRKLIRQNQRKMKEINAVDSSVEWYSIGPAKPEKPYVAIPGKDFYVETAEYQDKIDSNSWDKNLGDVFSFIKWATRPDSEIFDEKGQYKPGETDWSWAKNMNCKYLNVRIDMRDGGFVLKNDKGQRISLDALKWQYKFEDKNEKS
jgi:hypothetical protein